MRKKQTPTKSKLLKLREWLNVQEAARHLSNIFEEEISESDLLRIALDGRLKLSVYFVNHAKARCGKIVSYEDAKWEESTFASFIISGETIPDNIKGNPKKTREYIDQFPPEMVMKSLNLDGERYLTLDDDVTTICGVWDLPLGGGERLDVEHEYQQMTGGPDVTLSVLDGAFVEREGGIMCQLQESFDQNEYHKGSLAQLEMIKKAIRNNNIDEKRANELLDQHKKDREEYLNARNKKNESDDYYPAGGLPRDSVLVVRTRELSAFLNNLFSEDSEGETPKDISIFDSNHRFHAKELKIAIEAWTELYDKNPPEHVPSGGHKRYIAKWLEEKYSHLAQRAKDRIATIINPNPKGGASPTS